LQVNIEVEMVNWKPVYRCINCSTCLLRIIKIGLVVSSSGFSWHSINTLNLAGNSSD
jgi:hypothetical protein